MYFSRKIIILLVLILFIEICLAITSVEIDTALNDLKKTECGQAIDDDKCLWPPDFEDRQELCCGVEKYYTCLDGSVKNALCNYDETLELSKKIQDFLHDLEFNECESIMSCGSSNKTLQLLSDDQNNAGQINQNPWFSSSFISMIPIYVISQKLIFR